MATLYTKTKLYIEANSKTWDDTKVSLQNDTGTDYIKTWNYDISEPTAEQLASYETAGNTEEALQVILSNRRNNYPSIGDQLDMLWHTMDKDNELQHKFYDFYQTIKKVKVSFPKK